MKLGDFLTRAGSSRPSPTRSVSFKVIGYDKQHVKHISDATAELAFVNETERQEALRDANKIVKEAYGEAEIPPGRRDDEAKFHILFRALRDTDDVRQPLAESVKELKNALVLPEAIKVWEAYCQFVAEEFPDQIDAEMFQKMVEEAKQCFFVDLLLHFGSDVVLHAMPGLIRALAQ